MNVYKNLVAALFVLLTPFVHGATNYSQVCSEVFLLPKSAPSSPLQLQEVELVDAISHQRRKVLEFEFIRNLAEKMSLRVWLFGGTASSFLHYVKWDLTAQKGILDLQKERFDYDFTHIFRSTQDIDLVVNAAPEIAHQFETILIQRFPHFLGNKATKWEVRTLQHRMSTPGEKDFKEALLNDHDFSEQNTDSHSVGMIELTDSNSEPIIRDLRHWHQGENIFLQDALKDQITFFRSKKHFSTSRARAGENPEILSVLRILVKAFQFNLTLSPQVYKKLKKISDAFVPKKIENRIALRKIQDTAKKLVFHASNLEYAVNTLDQLGLRQKLIDMGEKNTPDNFAWWLDREPLRSFPVGRGTGATAKDLGIDIVFHETNHFLAMESIMRSHSGEPNVFISRKNKKGERAVYGDGFYVAAKMTSFAGTGLNIRFSVDPNARVDTDFNIYSRSIIVIKNKKALKFIPESMFFEMDDILRLAEPNQKLYISPSDRGLLQKQIQRFNSAKILNEIDQLLDSGSEKDLEKIIKILEALHNNQVAQLISDSVRKTVIKSIFNQISPWVQSSDERDILKFIRITEPIIKSLNSLNLLSTSTYVEKIEEFIQSPHLSFELRKNIFLILVSSNELKSNSQISTLIRSFRTEDKIRILQILLYTPKYQSILSLHEPHHENTLPDLIILARFNQNVRRDLIQLYAKEESDQILPILEQILEARDVSDENASHLIQQIKHIQKLKILTGVFGFEEILKVEKLVLESRIHDELTDRLIQFFDPAQINGELNLARALSLSFNSKYHSLQNFGIQLLKNPHFTKYPISQIFEKIIQIQNQNRNLREFKNAALDWLHSENELPEFKSIFLIAHFGSQDFLDYRAAIPLHQLPAVMKKITEKSFISTIEQFTQPEQLLGAKSESFIFRSYEFPKEGKKVHLGNPQRNSIDGSWWDLPPEEALFTESFSIQATPVTQLQWTLVMGKNPSFFSKDSLWNPNRPVELVSWNDAQEFIQKLNQMDPDYKYRLPTEIEWELAARAGSDTLYSFGNDPSEFNSHAWNINNSENITHEVASLKPNSDGLYDVHGNVWEWVQDWSSYRPTVPYLLYSDDTLSKTHRIIRGDDYTGSSDYGLRISTRDMRTPNTRSSKIGFRLVRVPILK